VARGEAVKPIVAPSARIRYPELFEIGEDSIVDDFCYFSTRVVIGRSSHFAPSVTVAGGPARTFRIGDLGGVASGARIYCTSDDLARDVAGPLPPGVEDIKEHLITGDVTIGDYCVVGANAVVMPRNTLPEGAIVAALAFVPPEAKLEPWGIYGGVPARFLGWRDREAVLRQAAKLRAALDARARTP
jgi:acetyltransferase-like isoleucine patch superfamily enzyme